MDDEHIILTVEMGKGKSDSCSGQLYRIFPHYLASIVENGALLCIAVTYRT